MNDGDFAYYCTILAQGRDFRDTCERFGAEMASRSGLKDARILVSAEGESTGHRVYGMPVCAESSGSAMGMAWNGELESALSTGRTRVLVLDGNKGGARSLICVPIVHAGRVLGALAAEHVDAAVTPADARRQMETLAALLAPVLQVRRMARLDKCDRASAEPAGPEREKNKHFHNFVGTSRAVLDVLATIQRVARTRATILLIGETGTGKELIAKAIHSSSRRKDKPFIRVNCSALSGQLLESELFGHVQGAFTGAVRDKVGRFEAAQGGTLLLDEISTMELPLQVKLLRVLQEREIERVGDVRTIPVDVRIIAATNEDLSQAVRAKRFRDDLFYRLNVVVIDLPPLRDRRDDIPRLVNHFLDKYNSENGRELSQISAEIIDVLTRYPWPGNVRELENTIERAVVLSQGPAFTNDLLPSSIRAFAKTQNLLYEPEAMDERFDDFVRSRFDSPALPGTTIWDRVMARVEHGLIREALSRCSHVKIKAADLLGINRNTLNKKCRELGIVGPADSDGGDALTTPDAGDSVAAGRAGR